MLIGEKIKSIRELRNYTQEYMADQLGITQAGYSKIEKGATSLSLSKLEQLSVILELPLQDILNFDSQRYFIQIKNTEKENSALNDSSIKLIKSLYEDKISLLEVLLGRMDSDLRLYKEKYGANII